MSQDLVFTGERFVPGVPGEIEFEHVHRYAFARRYVAGKRVLDAACGGYGTALLAHGAASATGVDIDPTTLAHATAHYAALPNIAFREASVTALPFPDASFDVIVSFETIEHLEARDQPLMLAEFARVLAPQGLLILSAPNRVEYSEKQGYANPFHRHEHDRHELDALLATHFAARRFHHQRVWLGSTLWREDGGDGHAAYVGDTQHVEAATPPPAMYFVVLAARAASDLPEENTGLSLFADPDEAELRRLIAQGGEIIHVNKELGKVIESLNLRSAHVLHLENLVAVRDHRVTELDARVQVLIAQGEAQERIIDYRHTLGWWFRLPWLRARGAWRRIVG